MTAVRDIGDAPKGNDHGSFSGGVGKKIMPVNC